MRKNASSHSRNTDKGKSYKKSASGESRGDRKPYKRTGSDKPTSSKRPFDKPERSGERSERPYADKGDRNFDKPDRPKRSFDKPARSGDRAERPYSDKKDRTFGKADKFDKSKDRSERPQRSFDDRDKPKRSFGDRDSKSAYSKRADKTERPGRPGDRTERPYSDRGKKSFDRPDRAARSFDDKDKPKRPYSDERKKSYDRPERPARSFDDKGKPKRSFSKPKESDFDKPYPLGTRKVSGPFRKQFEKEKDGRFREKEKPYSTKKRHDEEPGEVKEMTLNKYIAHSDQCSRRDAAELVKQGKVKVNGELMLDPGYRVQPYDNVTIAGKKLTPQKNRAYILMNKPKGYITTTEDPEGRKTVMELVSDSGFDRLFPVGRLDRNTTGLLLLTNDGDLAQKLSHPSYETKKVYQVTLNKHLIKADFEKILAGLELEDGPVKVDALSYLDSKEELGIEIHSGRNRIVRRIFESLGYEVEKLDRVMYAGLTKKNLPRGKWRFLNDKEIILLKHFKS